MRDRGDPRHRSRNLPWLRLRLLLLLHCRPVIGVGRRAFCFYFVRSRASMCPYTWAMGLVPTYFDNNQPYAPISSKLQEAHHLLLFILSRPLIRSCSPATSKDIKVVRRCYLPGLDGRTYLACHTIISSW